MASKTKKVSLVVEKQTAITFGDNEWLVRSARKDEWINSGDVILETPDGLELTFGKEEYVALRQALDAYFGIK